MFRPPVEEKAGVRLQDHALGLKLSEKLRVLLKIEISLRVREDDLEAPRAKEHEDLVCFALRPFPKRHLEQKQIRLFESLILHFGNRHLDILPFDDMNMN